jgi:hypothetical protein
MILQALFDNATQGPPPNLIDNNPKFEVEAMFKLRQLRGGSGSTWSSGKDTIQ